MAFIMWFYSTSTENMLAL